MPQGRYVCGIFCWRKLQSGQMEEDKVKMIMMMMITGMGSLILFGLDLKFCMLSSFILYCNGIVMFNFVCHPAQVGWSLRAFVCAIHWLFLPAAIVCQGIAVSLHCTQLGIEKWEGRRQFLECFFLKKAFWLDCCSTNPSNVCVCACKHMFKHMTELSF